MLRKLLKNKKAQNTAEYAILIALVVAAIIAMQTYAQRALQGKIRDASIYMSSATPLLGNTAQYEPYYLSSNFQVTRDENETEVQDTNKVVSMVFNSVRNRTNGFTGESYDTKKFPQLINGV